MAMNFSPFAAANGSDNGSDITRREAELTLMDSAPDQGQDVFSPKLFL